MTIEIIESNFENTRESLGATKECCKDQIIQACDLIIRTLTNERKILICGNGGSAADADHFAGEFVSSFSKDINRRGLSAISLTSNSAILTAYANDFQFEGVYQRQVEALGNTGDLLIAISTSGESVNCINAVLEAKRMGLTTIGMTGLGGKLGKIVDVKLEVPSKNTQIIQHNHIVMYHTMIEIVENKLFRNG